MNTELESNYSPELQEKPKNSKWPVVIGTTVGILVGFLLATLVAVIVLFGRKTSVSDSSQGVIDTLTDDSATSESKLQTILYIIKNYYYQDVDDQTLIDGVYAGIVESLDDPYSAY